MTSSAMSGPVPHMPGAAAPPPAKSSTEGRSWLSALLFLLPTGLLLGVFLVYPTIYTILLSFDRGRRGEFNKFLGLDNYVTLFTKDPNFIDFSHFPPSGALFNNILWLVFYTSIVIIFGLVIAVMASRVRYESIIKSVVFLPMAIAATALVGIWGSVGFATVILSAAIKSISAEIMEAARVDGANEIQIFRRIILPMVSLPISVLAVTLTVNVVKLFDLVYVMTLGGPGTSSRVIAFTMYQEAFPGGLFGKGAAVAVVMLIIMIPVMLFNIRRFRTESVT